MLITGAARGVGAGLAVRLHSAGARVGLLGLEPDLLTQVAARCGSAPWQECDVTDRAELSGAVEAVVERLGGLDVLVVNAGVASALPLVGGRPEVWDKIIEVNLTGAYNTVNAAGDHVSHPGGYVLLISSAAAAVQLPLMGAYSASKAGVEALGNTLRMELRPSGARVGVAYFGELDTDMTTRGFDSDAVRALLDANAGLHRVAPLAVGIDAVERAIGRRSRTVVAPARFRPLIPARVPVQRLLEIGVRRGVARSVALARTEASALTTVQPPARSAVARTQEPEA